jgi:hypothetical protein
LFWVETPEAGQPAGQGLVNVVSRLIETSPGFGSRPLTYAWRFAQQQWPSAMQHSISQTSGSQEASESGVEIHPNAIASAAAATRILNRIFSLMVIGRSPS